MSQKVTTYKNGAQSGARGVKPSLLPQFMVAQANPFAPEALGVKVPDASNAPSATALSRSELSFATGGSVPGVGFVARPFTGNYYQGAVSATATSWTWPAKGAPNTIGNSSGLVASFSAIRTCAYGIKLSCRQAYTAASGVVHVALVADVNDQTGQQFPTSVAQMMMCPEYRKVSLADLIEGEVIVSGRFTDETGFRYLDTSGIDSGSYSNSFPTTGWLSILVWVEGAPVSTSNVIDVEFIYHLECISGNGGNSVIQLTPAHPYSPATMAAVSNACNSMDPIIVVADSDEDSKSFWTSVKQAFDIGLKVANGVVSVMGYIAPFFL